MRKTPYKRHIEDKRDPKLKAIAGLRRELGYTAMKMDELLNLPPHTWQNVEHKPHSLKFKYAEFRPIKRVEEVFDIRAEETDESITFINNKTNEVVAGDPSVIQAEV